MIALCVDDNGLPKTVEDRIRIAKNIVLEAEKIGIKKQNIIVDPVMLTMATNPDIKEIISQTIIKLQELGLHSIVGLSNYSFGMPNRENLNAQIFQELDNLSLAIMNPTHTIIRQLQEAPKITKLDYTTLPLEGQLHNAILYGDEENILRVVNKALLTLEAMEINDILINALIEVGDKFDKKEYFLPQVLASAATMKLAFSRLKVEFKKTGNKDVGTFLIATVENDIHDIGKNIVIALAESNNYKVVDLGVNVPVKKILEAVKLNNPDIIGLSALMTTTVVGMEDVIKQIRQIGVMAPIIIGGAVVTEEYAKSISASYAKDALGAVREINELMKNAKNN